jgi:hypothetical protein
MKLLCVVCIAISLVACGVKSPPKKCANGFLYYKSSDGIWIKTTTECLSNE